MGIAFGQPIPIRLVRFVKRQACHKHGRVFCEVCYKRRRVFLGASLNTSIGDTGQMTERQRARAEFAKRKMIEIGERAEREERQKAIFSALNLTREQVAAVRRPLDASFASVGRRDV